MIITRAKTTYVLVTAWIPNTANIAHLIVSEKSARNTFANFRCRKENKPVFLLSPTFSDGRKNGTKKNDCLFYAFAFAIKIQMVGIRFLVGTAYMQSLCSSKHLSHKPLSMLVRWHVLISSRRWFPIQRMFGASECVCVCCEHKMDNNKNGMKQISHIAPSPHHLGPMEQKNSNDGGQPSKWYGWERKMRCFDGKRNCVRCKVKP